MVAAEDLLADSLGLCISEWFNPDFNHPFLGLHTISVPESVKQIPKRWVDDVEVHIDEGFGAEDGDVLGQGLTTSWSNEEGRGMLREALNRLDLREDHVAHPDVNRMGRHELSSEKRRVKQELKRYDAEFRRQLMRLPTHSEKEPMRPLYVYYRRLKNMLSQAEQSSRSGGGGGGRRSSSGATATATAGSDDEGPGLKFGPRESDEASLRQQQQLLAAAAGGGGQQPLSRRGQGGSSSLKDQISALEQRIESLQAEKGVVRTKLQAFQEKFLSENSRKIRFHKDILPIEREYRMYKNLKEEIMRAESQLRDLRA